MGALAHDSEWPEAGRGRVWSQVEGKLVTGPIESGSQLLASAFALDLHSGGDVGKGNALPWLATVDFPESLVG